MSIPSLAILAAQAFPKFLLDRGGSTPPSLPFLPPPFPETEPSSLSPERISEKKRGLLRELICELRNRLLLQQGHESFSTPQESLTLPVEVVDALDAVLFIEELSTEEIRNSPPSVRSQKARVFFYFLNTHSEEQKRLLEIFEQEYAKEQEYTKEQEYAKGAFWSLFSENIEILLSDLFLNLPFEEIRTLWKTALGLTEETSEERQSSPVEKMIEAYAGGALYYSLETRPSLLTSSHIEELKKEYPDLRKGMEDIQKLRTLGILSIASSGAAIVAFKKNYPGLSTAVLDKGGRENILRNLARNNSVESIVAFRQEYPELSAADLDTEVRSRVFISLAGNTSPEAKAAFKERYPEFKAGLGEIQRDTILKNLIFSSAEIIVAFKKEYPEFSAAGLSEMERFRIFFLLAMHVSVEVFDAFKKEYPEFSAAGLRKEMHGYILRSLAGNSSAEVIVAFKKEYPEISAAGLSNALQSTLSKFLAKNDSAAAVASFKKVYLSGDE